jgi:hypothetical protein
MNKLMIMAAVAAVGLWMTTGCSTCCKKDTTCTKPTASVTCTNTISADFMACGGGCTNKMFAEGCTNKLNADFIACGGGCTNKLTDAKL